MVAECAAAKCHTKRSRDSKSAGITFHTFPKDEALRRKWSVAMRRMEGWRPSQWDVVCSAHFLPADFDRTGQTVRLRKGVVPTVFPNLPQHLQKPTVKPRSTSNSQTTTMQELPGQSSKKRRISSVQINDERKAQPKLDHDYSCSSSEMLRQKWLGAQDQIQKLKQRLVRARMRECRAKKAVRAFLVGELGQKNVLSQEVQINLEECPIEEVETKTLSLSTQDSRSIQQKPKGSWNQPSTPRQRWLLRVMDTTLDFPCSVQDETEDQDMADSDVSAESLEHLEAALPTPTAPTTASCRNEQEDSNSGLVEHKEGSESDVEHRVVSKRLAADVEADLAPDVFAAFGNQVASELRLLQDTTSVRRLKRDIMNMIHNTRDAERSRSQR